MLQEIDAFTLVIIGSGLIFLLISLFLIIYYRYARNLMAESLKNNQLTINHQKELLKNEINIIEKERERLARDLHDEVGALLSYISMNLSTSYESDSNDYLKTKISESKTNLDDAISKVRQISHSLLPPTLELFGLRAAIEEFAESVKSDIEIKFENYFELSVFNNEYSLHLYRLILEFVNNSIKHSKCTKVEIKFKSQQSAYQLQLSDDGTGFNYQQAIRKSGLGLKNIESRISALESTHSFTSNDDGTSLVINIPKQVLNEKSEHSYS